MKVKDVMHTGVTWVDPGMAVADVAKRMRDEDIGAIPVGENDKLVGMVTDRDIAVRAVATGKDPKATKVRDVMTKGIVYCREDDTLENAAKVMEEKHIRRLPVINKQKRMVGMLSLGDIAKQGSPKIVSEIMREVSAHHA